MSDLATRLVGFGYEAGWSVAKAVPGPMAYRIADAAADLAVSRRGPAVMQYARNLKRVLGAGVTPEALRRATGAGIRSYARYWIETFRLPAMNRTEVADGVYGACHGLQHLDAAIEAGRGVVLVCPHSGNWDVAGLMLAEKYGSFVSVAERVEPDRLYRRFVAFRQSLGMEILPLTGGPTPTSAILKDRLRQGGIVCLLGDRDLTASGIPVEFFGGRTRMPAGPAMLAALTGAELMVGHLSFLRSGSARGWLTEIAPPLALPGDRLAERVRRGTQAVATAFQKGISAHPEDWHMLQPLWLDDLRT